jgi:hypothetical protein
LEAIPGGEYHLSAAIRQGGNAPPVAWNICPRWILESIARTGGYSIRNLMRV